MSTQLHDEFALRVFGPVVVVVWRGAVTADAVTAVERVLEGTAARSTQPIAFVTIAQFKAPVPDAAVRERIVECYARLGPKLGCVAQVVEGDGFWACAARCFIAGIGMLSTRERPMAVFGDVAAALEFTVKSLGAHVDRGTIVDGLGELRCPAG